MGKSGARSKKGVPENRWGETKQVNVNATMTLTGREALKERVRRIKIPLGEILELWGRGYKVDDESSLTPPKPEMTDLEVVLRSLPRLSPVELKRVIGRAAELLVKGGELSEKVPKDQPQTIAEFVASRRDACIQQFTDCGLNPKRVDEIIAGQEPTLREIGVLPECLDLEEEIFLEMYRREFKNGNGNHQASHSHH